MDEEDLLDLVMPAISEEDVWLQMWHTTAAKPGCSDAGLATNWADQGLAAFQQRFRRAGVRCDA